MLFNSLQFLVFLPVTLLFFYNIKLQYRWLVLLIASYLFYMAWDVSYIFLIVCITIVTYFLALCIESSKNRKFAIMSAGISLLLAVLFYFKYTNFIISFCNDLFHAFHYTTRIDPISILLPVGLSFYLFQSISYLVDVYRKTIDAEKHLGYFALYISFFPQLVAGPIARARDFLPQLRTLPLPTAEDLYCGIRLCVWGMFKKVVVADQLAIVVNTVYSNPLHQHTLAIIITTVLFSFQIYCDFSGYTDIARGIAHLFGIRLSINFKLPYFACGVQDFWRRWHISLSTWFKDYVYIPLGGNRRGLIRCSVNIFVVFLLSGLWHGASWTYVLWGALHGFFIVLEMLCRYIFSAVSFQVSSVYIYILKGLKLLYTFTVINILWIFFRSASVTDAWQFILKIFHYSPGNFSFLRVGLIPPHIASFTIIASIITVVFIEYIDEKYQLGKHLDRNHSFLRIILYSILVNIILLFGIFLHQDFIYFQF